MTATQLRRLIDRTGLRDAEIARRLGITRGHLCDLLAGNRRVTPELADAARRLSDGRS